MEWPTGTTELRPGVFAYVQAHGGLCIANAGIIAGGDATTVIDALFTPAMTRALLAEVQRVAPGPIATLLNTHHHVDHTLGNALFPADTRILAHARAKAEMEHSGLTPLQIIKRIAPHFEAELDGVTERLPDATFDGASMELTIGNHRVRLLHFGTGHTRGDVMVHLPDDRLLFTGDVGFFFVTPLAHEGHIGGWIRAGERIIDELDVDTLAPGHGPVGTKADLEKMLGYLRLVHTGARRGYDAGIPSAEAAAAIDLGEYAEWTEPERLPINVARCYQEFTGELDAIL